MSSSLGDILVSLPEHPGLRQRVKGSTPPPQAVSIPVVSSPPKKTAKDSLAAIVRLQRAFRRAFYRFDRSSLIDRLRLELRLKVVGGRVFVWLMLLAVVILNLASTHEGSSYNLYLTTSLASILDLSSFRDSHFWSDATVSVDNLMSLFYTFSLSSIPLTVWPPPSILPSVLSSSLVNSTYVVSTWTSEDSRALQARDSNLCWTIGLEEFSLTLDGIEQVQITSPGIILIALDNQIAAVSLNGTDIVQFPVPVCSTSYMLITAPASHYSSLYLYRSSPDLLLPLIPTAIEYMFPFLTDSIDPYIYQSLYYNSAPFDSFPANTYQFLTPGIAEYGTLRPPLCEIDDSALSALQAVYTGPTWLGSWCLPLSEPAGSFGSQVYNYTDFEGSVIKFVSFMYPGEMEFRNKLLIRQLVWIPTADRLVLIELTARGSAAGASSAAFLDGTEGFTAKQFQAFYSPSGLGWRGQIFSVSGIVGIVLSSIFFLKDLITLVINIINYKYERLERGKVFFWMISNVITSLLILIFLIGRISVGPNDFTANVTEIQKSLRGPESWIDKENSLAASLGSISDSFLVFREWEIFGIGVLYLLFARVVHSLSGHPRVGILTATWRAASDDFFHLSLNFVSLFLLQGIIGLIVSGTAQKNSSGELPGLMGTFGQVLLSQWRALVSGTFSEVSTDLDFHGSDWVLILYFAVFLATMRIFLLNFFIAILIDAYMAVRLAVSKNLATQSFFQDSIDTIEAHWLVQTGLLPKRAELIGKLVDMYALPVVTIDQLGGQEVFGTAKQGEYFFSNTLRRFCSRYFNKYSAVRARKYEEQNVWRTVLAEIEVLKNIINKT